MHTYPSLIILPNSEELSRRAAERYAVVTAAREHRSFLRRATRAAGVAETTRPLPLGSLFWKRRWS